MKRIILISDNHGDREVVDKALNKEKFNIAVHLGDAELPEEWIKERFDYYVGGNHDHSFSIFENSFELDGIKFSICHGHRRGFFHFKKNLIKYAQENGSQVVIHGHTHAFDYDLDNEIPIICPGAINLSRGQEGEGYTIVEMENSKIKRVEFKSI